MPTKVWLIEKEQEKIKDFYSTASDFLLKTKATLSSHESQVAAFFFLYRCWPYWLNFILYCAKEQIE